MVNKSPKILWLGDVHIGKKLYNIPELANDLQEEFSRVVQLAISLKADLVVLTGDTFDTTKPTENDVAFVCEEVRKLKAAGINVLAQTGDHDLSRNSKAWLTDVCGCTGTWIAESIGFPQVLGADYSDFFDLPKYLNEVITDERAAQVEWLTFHGQVPELFPFTEPKKTLDFKGVKLKRYTNLKGVVLSDIHKPVESTIQNENGGPDIYVGYCGSLGITKSDEIDTKAGILYFDGQTLKRLPYKLARQVVKIDFTKEENLQPKEFYKKEYSKLGEARTLFIVEYSKETKESLNKLSFLYDIGMVRTSRTAQVDGQTEHVNIRSDLGTTERIDSILKEACKDPEVYALTSAILTSEDPCTPLDEFKDKALV